MSALIKHNARAFLSQTGLHGLSYTLASRTRPESLFWAVLTALFISFGLYNCALAFVQLENDPLVIQIDSLSYDAAKVPFPAVTFCPDQALDELNVAATVFDQVRDATFSARFFVSSGVNSPIASERTTQYSGLSFSGS